MALQEGKGIIVDCAASPPQALEFDHTTTIATCFELPTAGCCILRIEGSTGVLSWQLAASNQT